MKGMRATRVVFIRGVECPVAIKMQHMVEGVCDKAGVNMFTAMAESAIGRRLINQFGITKTPALIKYRLGVSFGEILTGSVRRDRVYKWVRQAVPASPLA